MLSYLTEVFTGIVDLFNRSPVVFTLVFGAGVSLIWLKYRWIARAQANVLRDNYAGWSQGAKTAKVTHETGIGTKDVLIMRPIKFRSIAIWTLLFFGGGSVVLGFDVFENPNEMGFKDYFGFVSCILFAALSLWLLALSFTKIVIDGNSLHHRGLFRRRAFKFESIQAIEPLGKSYLSGVKLTFKDTQTLKIIARMTGYRDLLEQLAAKDPKLQLVVRGISRSLEKLNA